MEIYRSYQRFIQDIYKTIWTEIQPETYFHMHIFFLTELGTSTTGTTATTTETTTTGNQIHQWLLQNQLIPRIIE